MKAGFVYQGAYYGKFCGVGLEWKGDIHGDISGTGNTISGNVYGDVGGMQNKVDGDVRGNLTGSTNTVTGTVYGRISGSGHVYGKQVHSEGSNSPGLIKKSSVVYNGDFNWNVNGCDDSITCVDGLVVEKRSGKLFLNDYPMTEAELEKARRLTSEEPLSSTLVWNMSTTALLQILEDRKGKTVETLNDSTQVKKFKRQKTDK